MKKEKGMRGTEREATARRRTCAFLLVAFSLVTFFAYRGALPTDIMESRNIVTAREMVADGHWLVPTMNGDLRLEKPPLPTWVAAGIEMACPGSLAAQRTAAGVMGLVWTLYLFLLVRYMSGRDDLAVATVLVFLTCYNLVLMSRSATWDIYCHAFMMAAIYYLTRAIYEDHHYRQWFLLAGVFMGLSFLSKGPVSFYALLLPYLLTLVVLPGPIMKGKWPWVALMVVVMAVVGGWWYAWLLAVHPREVAAVAAKETAAWTGHNVRPWWYYWRFFLEMGAWAPLMLAALAVPYWRRHIAVKREYLLSVTWALASLVLLSLMPEKKTRYLLPTLAPCAIVVACLVVHFKQGAALGRVSKALYVGNGLLVTAIVLFLPVLAWRFGVRDGIIGMPTEVLVCVVMAAIAAWLLWTTLRYRPMRYAAGVAALFAFAELTLLGTIGHSLGNPHAHSIAAVRGDRRLDGIAFYHDTREPVRIELVYEAGRKILPLDLADRRAVAAALPCAVVTRRWAGEELSPAVLAAVDTVAIGTFDDNKHPASNRHYTPALVSHVTLLRAKAAGKQ